MIIHSNIYNSKTSFDKKSLNTVNVEAKIEVIKKPEVKILPIIEEKEEVLIEEKNIFSEEEDVFEEE